MSIIYVANPYNAGRFSFWVCYITAEEGPRTKTIGYVNNALLTFLLLHIHVLLVTVPGVCVRLLPQVGGEAGPGAGPLGAGGAHALPQEHPGRGRTQRTALRRGGL